MKLERDHALPRLNIRQIDCCVRGVNPTTAREGAIGQDFLFNWQRVHAAADKQGLNLDSYISLPIAARLIEKKLSSQVTFWYTPLNDLFVVTVCSKRQTDFMNPLHSLPGYTEYGQGYLRPNARPFIFWDGQNVMRIHPVSAAQAGENLIGDFGNQFGLTVAELDAQQYQEILASPVEYFEYFAVPDEPETRCDWNGKSLVIRHALCELK